MSDVLSQATLQGIQGVSKPTYLSNNESKAGIVHIGIGAFHRAHQAVYTDDLLELGYKDWKITAVSLRSNSVKLAMQPQDYLYSVVERDGERSSTRIVGAVESVLVVPEQPEQVIDALAAEDTQVVTLTVTEKGYCRDKSGNHLDTQNAGVQQDLAQIDLDLNKLQTFCPKTLPGLLVAACIRRRESNRKLTIISCDNLPSNGVVTKNIVLEFAQAVDAELAKWIGANVGFCNSMVDRIVPATTEQDYQRIKSTLGVSDKSVVGTEPFKQWVIEDNFVTERPPWDKVGAMFVDDVEPFEEMKLRLLNGAHSALAYIGFLMGYEFIHQAVKDADLAQFIAMLHQDILPTLDKVPDIDLPDYSKTIVARFANHGVPYKTTQVACDGSQKLPQRLCQPANVLLAKGIISKPIAFVVAAWCRFVEASDKDGQAFTLIDPMADVLQTIAQDNKHDDAKQVAGLLNEAALCTVELLENNEFINLVVGYLKQIHTQGMAITLASFIAQVED